MKKLFFFAILIMCAPMVTFAQEQVVSEEDGTLRNPSEQYETRQQDNGIFTKIADQIGERYSQWQNISLTNKLIFGTMTALSIAAAVYGKIYYGGNKISLSLSEVKDTTELTEISPEIAKTAVNTMTTVFEKTKNQLNAAYQYLHVHQPEIETILNAQCPDTEVRIMPDSFSQFPIGRVNEEIENPITIEDMKRYARSFGKMCASLTGFICSGIDLTEKQETTSIKE